MKRNYIQEFNEATKEARKIAIENKTCKGQTIYLCFTKYGLKKFKELNSRFYEDTIRF